MALPTVIRPAIDAVRAYFQREWNDQIMNFNEIPPAAIPALSEAYKLLSVVFTTLAVVSYAGVNMLLGIDSRSLREAPWKMALVLYWFWLLLFCTRSFSFFYRCSDTLFIMGIMQWILASIVSDHSPSLTWKMYMATACFVLYVTAYTQMMARRIVQHAENSIVKHAICIFTEFPYVSYHIARTTLMRITYKLGAAQSTATVRSGRRQR